jgi:hypothetical protein
MDAKRWIVVISVGISTRTAGDFPTFLNRPQEKTREFSWIKGHLHSPVLALRMHEGYS